MNSYKLILPNTTPGEHMPLGQAELSYPAGIKKQNETLWNPPASVNWEASNSADIWVEVIVRYKKPVV